MWLHENPPFMEALSRLVVFHISGLCAGMAPRCLKLALMVARFINNELNSQFKLAFLKYSKFRNNHDVGRKS
jgi:hypothetical protein